MNRQHQVTPILLVLFLSYLGFAMALPIFPPMFLNSDSIVAQSIPSELRTFFLGLLIASYPLGQLFGGPFLGHLSDVHGRKPILVYTLLLIIPTYLASAYAIHIDNLPLLYISRFVCGLFEGNSVIASASMADISTTSREKGQRFSLILTVSSLGFILGPYMGGKLSDSSAITWFSYATPFLLGALLTFISLLFIAFMYKETLPHDNRPKFEFFPTIRSIFTALFRDHLRNIFLSNFFIFLSFFLFFGFFPVLLVKWFHFNATHIGEIISYLALPVCFSPLLFAFLSARLRPRNAMILSAIVLMLSILALLFSEGPITLYFTLIPVGLSIAICWTYSSLIISDQVSQAEQGQALGTNQSITILAEIIAGTAGGALAGIRIFFPLLIGAVMALLAALWLYFFVQKRDHSAST